jgi:hypothetical protein
MAGDRFFRRGKTRAFFVASIAAPAAPTAAEIAAGTEISDEINDIQGFGFKTDRIDVPALDSEFTPSIGGEQKADDSSLTLYLNSDSNPLRTTLAFGSDGFIVFCDYKPSGAIIATDVVDVYPVNVIGAPKARSLKNDPATWEAQLAVTAVPSEDVAVV